eukprot:CAMPEP_0178780744 /NCGR_PEP_ID=MMETSP0745-20121128/2230_1 /TAXON_ID=913974 /ORGANISM="Nitzschia punctata, Strain CCMP561" /LENGTH=59 /DNA_ID=CAMNT_0020438039 /DNA_START=138 /DNA_END=317 /DNA_ORIENTATION=+
MGNNSCKFYNPDNLLLEPQPQIVAPGNGETMLIPGALAGVSAFVDDVDPYFMEVREGCQ